METEAPANTEEALALEFSKLWTSELAAADVFAFLASHPEINDELRLEVLLVDQRERWLRQKPLPLRVYLSAFPAIAARGEMVRALVDGERAERRRSWGLAGAALNPNTLDAGSETPTQPIEGDVAPDDTQVEEGSDPKAARVTVDQGVPPTGLRSTRSPTNVTPTEEPLSFAIDEAYQLQSEAEALRVVLNRVRFTLVRRIGAGGMGVVYETYDQLRGELVALKTMRRVDPAALVRFKQEFRSLSDITHPNLANLYELFAVEDRWFFTMELVEGCDFISFVKGTPEEVAARWNAEPTVMARPPRSAGGPSAAARSPNFHFDEKRLRDALSQLALGVSALHAAGKLHRDIKPPNVLVTHEGRVVLLDFGLTADLASVGSGATGRGNDRPHVAGTGGGRRREHGERLVRRRRDAVRGHDRAASVFRDGGGHAGGQAEVSRRLRRIPRSWDCRRTWYGCASTFWTATPRNDQAGGR